VGSLPHSRFDNPLCLPGKTAYGGTRQSRWHGISANDFAILVRAYCCKALRMPAAILRAYRAPALAGAVWCD
jgi:hypothetical protein